MSWSTGITCSLGTSSVSELIECDLSLCRTELSDHYKTKHDTLTLKVTSQNRGASVGLLVETSSVGHPPYFVHERTFIIPKPVPVPSKMTIKSADSIGCTRRVSSTLASDKPEYRPNTIKV